MWKWENESLLLNGAGEPVIQTWKKAEVIVPPLPQSFFTNKTNLQGPEKMVKDSSKEEVPLV